MDRGVPRVIPGADGEALFPSILSVNENGEVLVGKAAQDRLLEDPQNTVFSVKRLMGRGAQDEDLREEIELFHFPIAPDSDQVIRLKLRERVFTPPEISAHILRALKEVGEEIPRRAGSAGGHYCPGVL